VVASYNLDTTQVFGGSPRNPLPTSLILDAQEVSNASAAVQAYNTIIGSVANARGLALVDANALLRQFQTGILYNGVGVNAAFISGGLFSLDGVHLTPRGYAITANEFIKAINCQVRFNHPAGRREQLPRGTVPVGFQYFEHSKLLVHHSTFVF
jgi:lysophospholipase L1-like esterase